MFNSTKQEEREYLERKRRVNKFYSSTKFKGIRRPLSGDEYFDSLFLFRQKSLKESQVTG